MMRFRQKGYAKEQNLIIWMWNIQNRVYSNHYEKGKPTHSYCY